MVHFGSQNDAELISDRPKISEIVKAEWMWKPIGWPKERDLPAKGLEKLDEILLAWMSMALEDSSLAKECRKSILNSIDDGYVCGNNWFDSSCQEDFLEFLSGSDDEKSAISMILDKLEGGVHVRQDGLVFDLDERVVRFHRMCNYRKMTSNILKKYFRHTM